MNSSLIKLVYFLFLFFLILDCHQPSVSKHTKTYLHLSHTRTEADDTIDSITLEIDYDQFDMLWLGGDLTYYTSKIYPPAIILFFSSK